MRGRKPLHENIDTIFYAAAIKKESPNKGTETFDGELTIRPHFGGIKKESPNEGTETLKFFRLLRFRCF